MAEALRANIAGKLAISLQRGPVDQKFQLEGVAPINCCFSQRTRLNDHSYGIKIWTDLSYILSQITSLADKRTYRILIATLRLHCMQRGKNYADISLIPSLNFAACHNCKIMSGILTSDAFDALCFPNRAKYRKSTTSI